MIFSVRLAPWVVTVGDHRKTATDVTQQRLEQSESQAIVVADCNLVGGYNRFGQFENGHVYRTRREFGAPRRARLRNCIEGPRRIGLQKMSHLEWPGGSGNGVDEVQPTVAPQRSLE